MNGGEMMVVMIVAIVMIAGIMKRRYRNERDFGERFDPAADAESRRLQEEVRALRERIQVLERVITDTHSTSSLDQEIEKLRDRDRA